MSRLNQEKIQYIYKMGKTFSKHSFTRYSIDNYVRNMNINKVLQQNKVDFRAAIPEEFKESHLDKALKENSRNTYYFNLRLRSVRWISKSKQHSKRKRNKQLRQENKVLTNCKNIELDEFFDETLN